MQSLIPLFIVGIIALAFIAAALNASGKLK